MDQTKPGPNRKRQLAGALLVLLVCYPLSAGPFSYAVGRGWVSFLVRPATVFYVPAHFALSFIPIGGGRTLAQDWYRWQYESTVLGIEHAKQR